MKEKLLAALKTKFQGVQDATLERIATKKAETVTEEDKVQTVVDGMKYDDIIQSETDFRVQQASKTAREKAVKEYEEKHKLKDGKPQEKKEDPPEDPKDDGEKIPKWAQGLIKENKELKESISGMTKNGEIESKKAQALGVMAKSKIPEKLHSKWANRLDYESDTPMEEQITELETEYVDLQQETINTAVKEGNLAPGSGGAAEVEKEELDDYMKDKFPEEAEK
jgi:hypothetical protein